MSETICLDTKREQKDIGITIDRTPDNYDRVEVCFTHKNPDKEDIYKSLIIIDKGDTIKIVADTPDNYTKIEV